MDPKFSIITHSDKGLLLSLNQEMNDMVRLSNITGLEVERCVYSNTVILIYSKEKVILYDIKNCKQISEFVMKEIKEMKISDSENLYAFLSLERIFYVFTKEKIIFQEKFVEKFSFSDDYLLILKNGEATVYKIMDNEFNIISKERNVFDFSVHEDSYVIVYKKSEKNVFKLQINSRNVVSCFEFEKLEKIEMKKKDNNFLFLITTDYVTNTYFGHTKIFFYSGTTRKLKEIYNLNPIHSFCFLNDGFAICYGDQPSNVSIYDYNCQEIKKFPRGVRNKMYFNLHENLVCFCGFNNLSGEIEIYGIQDLEIKAKLKELGASSVCWSPCGRYFCVATTKELRVDNKISVFDYFGRKIVEKNFEKLESCFWFGEKENFTALEKPKNMNLAVEKHYVPPNLRNSNYHQKLDKKHQILKKSKGKINNSMSKEDIIDKLNTIKELKKRLESGEKLNIENLNLISSETFYLNELNKKS
ncbi:translation initiation factor 2A [Hamiltosporidium magnivora]|uniref:Eukaryotic translation initiation factor 2A n=1 Tax=Hamiltosporidium magnivora TaxID=148818 RepID=A0A4Q9L784_9MICR|nr:translation initiation factor 2A [Hamiltosporidium magnivora]